MRSVSLEKEGWDEYDLSYVILDMVTAAGISRMEILVHLRREIPPDDLE
jgi:hypothetical protein